MRSAPEELDGDRLDHAGQLAEHLDRIAAGLQEPAPLLTLQHLADVAGQGEEVQSPFADDAAEVSRGGQANVMAGPAQAGADGHKGLDIASGTTRQDGDMHLKRVCRHSPTQKHED
jgi:hypothetical protein